MHQYLMGQGYWTYIFGALETRHVANTSNLSVWEQRESRALYCLVSCVHEHMLTYILDANTPKEAWDSLKWLLTMSTMAKILQFKQKLNNVWQANSSVVGYTLKIKDLCDSLGTINVKIQMMRCSKCVSKDSHTSTVHSEPP